MHELKRLLKRIRVPLLVYVALFAGLEVLASTILVHPRWREVNRELFSQRVKAKVLIYGSSRAISNLDPRVLETDDRKVFDFGITSAAPAFQLKFYNRYLAPAHYPSAQFVILEAGPANFDDRVMVGGWEGLADSLPFTEVVKLLAEQKIKLDKNSFWDLSALLKNRHLVSSALLGVEPFPYLDTTHSYHGYLPPVAPDTGPKLAPLNSNFSETEGTAFENLLKQIALDDRRLVVVVTPVASLGEKDRDNLVKVAQFCKDHDVTMIDLSESLRSYPNQKSLFCDGSHLSALGAREASHLLLQRLEKLATWNAL